MVVDTQYRRSDPCWRCKRNGHYRRACTFASRVFCSHCGKDGVLSRNCSCQGNQLEIKQPLDDSRYHIPICLNGLQITALVDTGATQTYLSQRIAQSLKMMGSSASRNNGVVKLADQTLATNLSIFPINITYEGKSIPLESLEIPSLAEDVILGMDFLTACNLELRLNGKLITPTEVNRKVRGTLNTIISREFLTEDENKRLNQLFETRKNRFEETTGLCTVAEREIVLRHTKPAPPKRYIKPKDRDAQPPKKFVPPPEARPRVLENIQISPPTLSTNRPPLHYCRRVRLPQPPPANDCRKEVPIPVAEGPSTSQTCKPSQPKPQPEDQKEKLFAGITIPNKKQYKYHQQFLIKRKDKPAVQVTIMSRTTARLRCRGQVKFVRIGDATEGRND